MKLPLFFCSLLFLTSCTSRQCHFSALAEQNQQIIYQKGIEGISSQSNIHIVCLPSDTFASIWKKKMLEFEFQIFNGSDRAITLIPENIRASDSTGQYLQVLKSDHFEKSLTKEIAFCTFGQILEGFSDICYADEEFAPENRMHRENKEMLRDLKDRAQQESFEIKSKYIKNRYLKPHTIFPNSSYQGNIVIKSKKTGNELVQLELYIPELQKREKFTFLLSAS